MLEFQQWEGATREEQMSPHMSLQGIPALCAGLRRVLTEPAPQRPRRIANLLVDRHACSLERF